MSASRRSCLTKVSANHVLFLAVTLVVCHTALVMTVRGQESLKWKWLHPTPQGNVLRWCKLWDANTWYAVGNEGTFIKTTDGGAHWNISYEAGNLLSPGNRLAAIHDAHFFDRNAGVLIGFWGTISRTTDGGQTFSRQQVVAEDTWQSLSFVNSTTGYMCGYITPAWSGRLMKTTDAGISWVPITSVPTAANVPFLSVSSPNDTLIVIGCSSGNIIRSTDGGNSWSSPINAGSQYYLDRMRFANRDTGFASGYGTFSVTTDGGITWTARTTGLPLNYSYLDVDIVRQESTLIVFLTGHDRYLYRSSNLGVSWDTVNFVGENQSALFSGLSSDFLNAEQFLTVGVSGMINMRSDAGRMSYTYAVKASGDVYDIWTDQETGRVITVGVPSPSGNDQILSSSDDGETWSVQPVNSGATFKSICMVEGTTTGYIAGSSGQVWKSGDGGESWTNVSFPSAANLEKVDFVNKDTGWVFGASGTIFKTTNGGINWVQQTASGVTASILSADMIDATTGWFVGGWTLNQNGTVCKTTDGGSTWVFQNADFGSFVDIFDIQMLDSNSGFLSGEYGRIRKTTNGGATWNTVLTPFTGYAHTKLNFTDMQNGFVSASGSFTMKTTNGGTTWQIDRTPTDMGIPDGRPLRMPFHSGGGGLGVTIFRYVDSTTVGVSLEWNGIVPSSYTLGQNYPNPFNPTTTIEFSLPQAGRVSLKVFDILGREVSTLVDEMDLNPGTMRSTFDASQLTSGVYFYSLIVDGEPKAANKMLLLK